MTPSLTIYWLPFGWDGLALRWIILYRSRTPSKVLRDHEEVHISQQRRLGILTYLFRYLTSGQFRYDMEKEAYEKGSGLDFYRAHLAASRYRKL